MASSNSWNLCRSMLRRNISSMLAPPQHRSVSSSVTHLQSQWTLAVSNAEKVVGYPTSFLSLRCLMSDEISNIAVYLKKLIGTGHPLLTTAKKLVYSKDHTHQTRGLLILLVSKASNNSKVLAESAKTDGILTSQRSLAEITELIHTAHLIHNGVINLRTPDENLEMGNKMAILCGDFLLAHACVSLAALQNVKVVELISQSISDISTAEFVELTANEADPLEKWKQQAQLRYGSLLANACQSTLILGGSAPDLIQQAHSLGHEIALAWQANTELESYRNSSASQKKQHILTHVFPPDSKPSQIEASLQSVRDAHADKAVEHLCHFPQNDATSALTNIVKALKH